MATGQNAYELQREARIKSNNKRLATLLAEIQDNPFLPQNNNTSATAVEPRLARKPRGKSSPQQPTRRSGRIEKQQRTVTYTESPQSANNLSSSSASMSSPNNSLSGSGSDSEEEIDYLAVWNKLLKEHPATGSRKDVREAASEALAKDEYMPEHLRTMPDVQFETLKQRLQADNGWSAGATIAFVQAVRAGDFTTAMPLQVVASKFKLG